MIRTLSRLTSASCFVTAFLFLAACSKGNPVVGNWKLVDIDYSRHIETIDPEMRQAFINWDATQRVNVVNKTFFNFEEDGKLKLKTTEFGGGEELNGGTWYLNESKDSLYLNSTDNEFFGLKALGNDTLVLDSGDQPYRKLILVRQ